MKADWPSLNSRAWFRLRCCGAEHPTRVEGFTDKGCILATPSLPHNEDVDPSVTKNGFFLGWVSVQQAVEMPVKLVKTNDDPVPMWTVEADGKVSETQRRAYVRVNVEYEVELELIPRGSRSLGRAVDLSEGGVKCFVDEWAPDPKERMFETTLTLEGVTYNIPTQIAWWGRLGDDNRRPAGLQFHHRDQRVADAIRSFVFALQLEQRRSRIS